MVIAWFRVHAGLFLLLFSLVHISWSFAVPEINDDTLATVRARLFNFFLNNGDCTQSNPKLLGCTGDCAATCDASKSFTHSLNPSNFTWSDINYADQTRSSWATSTHLSRVLLMSQSFMCVRCGPALFSNSSILAQIKGALDFWLRKDFQNPNWWWNAFGVPQLLEITSIVLGRESLTYYELDKILAILLRANGTYTGENLVWSLEVLIGRAVLAQDVHALRTAFGQLWQALFFSAPGTDGVQIDGSFFQHGPLLQSGSYGSGFSLDLIVYTHIAANTSVAITPSSLAVLERLVLDGQQVSELNEGHLGIEVDMLALLNRECIRSPCMREVLHESARFHPHR